ncbi:MAG: tryptophan 7-halogenase [Blastococcus sp.]
MASRELTAPGGREPFDVVVVGGGPAGSAAAITAAAAGLTVAMLDSAEPGSARPGETLHPGVEVVLRELGVGAAVDGSGWLRHSGHWVEWDGPPRFEAFGADVSGPWFGYQAPRRELDDLLLARAAEAGATVVRGCRAVEPSLTDGRVDGVLTDSGRIAAGHVIDASGRRHWSARRLGFPVHRVSRPLIASWGHLTGRWPERDDAPLLRADPTGWTWTARVGAGTYAWVGMDVTGSARLRDAPAHPAGLTVTGGPSGADVTWRRAAIPAAPGLLVAGDAAGVLDPASGSGVLRALVTGSVAARAVVDVRAGRLAEPHVVAAYRRWLAAWFRADVARLDELYRVFPDWTGRDEGPVLADVSRYTADAGAGARPVRPGRSAAR